MNHVTRVEAEGEVEKRIPFFDEALQGVGGRSVKGGCDFLGVGNGQGQLCGGEGRAEDHAIQQDGNSSHSE